MIEMKIREFVHKHTSEEHSLTLVLVLPIFKDGKWNNADDELTQIHRAGKIRIEPVPDDGYDEAIAELQESRIS